MAGLRSKGGAPPNGGATSAEDSRSFRTRFAAFHAAGGPAPDDDNPFNNPLHPNIRVAFDAAAAQAQDQATVVQACNHIIENGGWGTLQEVAMKRATAADFEAAIRGMEIEELPRFMRRMSQMRLQREPTTLTSGKRRSISSKLVGPSPATPLRLALRS